MDIAETQYPKWSNNPRQLQLDPDGDIILIIRETYSGIDHEFLVSSSILSKASKYFKVLFKYEFLLGTPDRKTQCTQIRLENDNIDAMEIILSALHFQYEEKHHLLEGPALAAVAMYCDKYDCVRAIRPWAYLWLSNPEILDRQCLISHLVAAFFFRDSQKFEDFSRHLILRFDEDRMWAWSKEQVGGMLPEPIRGEKYPILGLSQS